MPEKTIPDLFDVEVYGDMVSINQTLSRARCRIFYKYENRNGGYISDEFAEKLISTIPYAPIKGIFDGEAGDFRDHGYERTEGRIYGVVMADPNFAWEQHTDKDGATRTYACVDVLLFTGLYPQARLIAGKPQSMELYPPSIKGEWKNMGGPYDYYVYEDACFLGLQVLGEDVEPCFEGASFFSLVESVQDLIAELKKFELSSQQKNGGDNMDNLDKATVGATSLDEEAQKAIEDLVDETEAEKVEDVVEDEVEDDAAEEESDAEPEKEEEETEEEDEVEDDAEAEAEEEAEDDAEDDAEVDEDVAADDNSTDSDENFVALEQKIAEQETTIATLTTEKENFEAQIKDLEEELSVLRDFKLNVETLKKVEIIDSYEELLSEEIIETYKAKIDTYTNMEDLDKDLAYELKKSNSTVFSKNADTTPGFVPSGEPMVDGLAAILEKYRK